MASIHAGLSVPRPSRRRVSFSPQGGISRMPGYFNETKPPYPPRRWKRVVLPKELPSLREGSTETPADQESETLPTEIKPSSEPPTERVYNVAPAFNFAAARAHNLSESTVSLCQEDDLVEMMKHSLHLATQAPSIISKEDTPSIMSKDDLASKVRDTSSSYGSKDDDLVRARSPASPPSLNTLNETNLSRYSEGNDQLSNLHSSPRPNTPCSTLHDAADEAAATANEWKSEPRLEISTCDGLDLDKSEEEEEVLPSDSVSQCRAPPDVIQRCPRCQCSSRATFESTRAIKSQYDGGGDASGFESPQFGTKLHPINFGDKFQSKKRKPSTISLKSISSHIPKKAKKLKIFANDIIQEGTIRFNKLKSKLKKQNDHSRSNFEAWKANRRRARPGDPIKGKPQPSYAMFNLEKSVHGNKDDWWKEGVRRYRAPSWMVFGVGAQPAV
ncbi:unnamed protein product [Clonostachys chloroleuca]|uniref:Uncharacterized protein n=1 Tax=Clonostachys chloroleuca TaxID=1926264 RepID=A0AA35VJN9_9HYPO|nr:unnamed protein product [Clonostachys chloroleuca]